jgi:hypothetical protein
MSDLIKLLKSADLIRSSFVSFSFRSGLSREEFFKFLSSFYESRRKKAFKKRE